VKSWWQETFPNGQQILSIRDALDREVRLAYGEVGNGQPLFLLHGIGSWSFNWRHNIQALSQQFRVICVDAKGYGFSQTASPPEIPGHQIVELSRMIEALSDQSVLVAAESLGALTALAGAQTYPHLIERLVLINVPIFSQKLPSWGMQALAYLPLFLVQGVDQAGVLRPFEPLIRMLTRWVRQEVVFDPTQITDAEVEALIYPYLYHAGTLSQFVVDLQLAAHEIVKLERQQPNLLSTIQQNLPQVACPTLILWSDCDRWFPSSNGEKLRERLPNAQLQIIPNCGHVASSDNPELVNTAILEFLSNQGS
jgi:pimeloyl-ACP methyl ester carboxylesterase